MDITCNMCKQKLSIDNFYKSSKYRCKQCVREVTAKWKESNPERTRNWRLKNRWRYAERQNNYYKKWYAENGRKRDPAKRKAHNELNNTINKGDLARPSKCSNCNRTEKIEAHHNDYSKPLEVVWLCNRCHREKHTGY